MFWWQIHIIDKCTMKFAPFYNTEYDIGQPENDFGNSQSPGSLLSPSVPPFPTSWETLQVVCCQSGLSIVICCCFLSPNWTIIQTQWFFWTEHLHFFISVMNWEGARGVVEKPPCNRKTNLYVILQETAARLLFMAVSFHIFILFIFSVRKPLPLSFFTLRGPYLA